MEVFQGAKAYEFLLRVACGLESKVMGETDVFGQLKEAWASHQTWMENKAFSMSPEEKQSFRKLQNDFQRVFEDTKEIRTHYLQNVGGSSSYGSLVRKLLREQGLEGNGPALLLGAGKLAASVAPWLNESKELWILNRSNRGIEQLKERLEGKLPQTDVKYYSSTEISEEMERELWQKAAFAILCVPVQPQKDRQRCDWWKNAPASLPASLNEKKRIIIHLGGYRAECSDWNPLPGFWALDDLFAAFEDENQKKASRFDRAGRACEEKALLRSLSRAAGGPVNLPHGWEDLAVFA